MKLKILHEDTDTKQIATVAVFVGTHLSDAKVLLVKRKSEPEKGKWCLPGGHGRPGESHKQIAERELEEETGLKIPIEHVMDTLLPAEDPRGKEESIWVSVVDSDIEVEAGDDAKDYQWAKIKDLMKIGLAFGHYGYVLAALKHATKATNEELVQIIRPDRILSEDKDKKEVKKGKGLLIVFEGSDGMGKTTQKQKLVEWLDDHGYEVEQSEWNSAKGICKAVKKLKKKRELTPWIFSLMGAADMVYRYENEIVPALEKNRVVVCDRYGPYTSKVRDTLRGIKTDYLDDVYKDLRKPDVVFYCHAPVEVAFARLLKSKGLSYYGSGMDLKYSENAEENCVEYERQMGKEYTKLMENDSNCHKLDMDRTIDEIFEDVKNTLQEKFGIGRFKIS